MTPLQRMLEAALGVEHTMMLFDLRDDPFASRVKALQDRTTIFASGLSRTADFTPAAWCEHGVGVEIGELSDRAMRDLARAIVTYGAACFVDTGEFGRFKRSLAGKAAASLDFDRILARYDQLLDMIAEENEAEERLPPPLLVAPDNVGDQQASFDLVRRHGDWIRAACTWGPCEVIIPIQLGARPPAEIYDALTQTLGTNHFRVGIPSNASAFSARDLIDFVQSVRPTGLHFLGAFAQSRLTPRLAQLVKANGDDVDKLSADGNPLRSVIVKPGQGGHVRADRLAAALGQRHRIAELRSYLDATGGFDGLAGDLGGPDARRIARWIAWVLGLAEHDVISLAQRA